MPSEGSDLVKTIISGVITGGASAATTFLSVFRTLKAKVTDLEGRVGNSVDPKTGLYLTIATLEDNLRRLKREIDGWDDTPPDWAKRMIQRAKVNASSDLNTVVDIESRVDARLRSFQERLASLEDELTAAPSGMTREEFLEDAKLRVREMSEIRQEVAAVNGLLKGVLVALGKDPEIR